MSSENEGQSLNEPLFSYGNKKVRFFESAAGQENEMIRYWASTTPLQRLANLYQLIRISFGVSDDRVRKAGMRRVKFLRRDS